MKEEKFLHSRKTSHRLVFGELWNLIGQHNWEKAHTHTHTHTHRIHTYPQLKAETEKGTDAPVCQQ